MCANILVTEWYPPGMQSELANLYQEVAQKPLKVLKKVGDSPYGALAECGFKNVTVYEVDDTKLADGIEEAISCLSSYASVDGYRVQIEVVYPIAEAIAVMQSTAK